MLHLIANAKEQLVAKQPTPWVDRESEPNQEKAKWTDTDY